MRRTCSKDDADDDADNGDDGYGYTILDPVARLFGGGCLGSDVAGGFVVVWVAGTVRRGWINRRVVCCHVLKERRGKERGARRSRVTKPRLLYRRRLFARYNYHGRRRCRRRRRPRLVRGALVHWPCRLQGSVRLSTRL